jgi:hypothetical protein
MRKIFLKPQKNLLQKEYNPYFLKAKKYLKTKKLSRNELLSKLLEGERVDPEELGKFFKTFKLL